jgi:hypothetical protein
MLANPSMLNLASIQEDHSKAKRTYHTGSLLGHMDGAWAAGTRAAAQGWCWCGGLVRHLRSRPRPCLAIDGERPYDDRSARGLRGGRFRARGVDRGSFTPRLL